jgi:hypothetical protein
MYDYIDVLIKLNVDQGCGWPFMKPVGGGLLKVKKIVYHGSSACLEARMYCGQKAAVHGQ